MGRPCVHPGTAAPTHLPDHDGESKDTREVVQQLEDNLEERLGVWQAPDGDEGFDCPVVAADVTGRSRGGSLVMFLALRPVSPFRTELTSLATASQSRR